jgi:hypothetical protein
MIKLCVGVAKVETLERRAAKNQWLIVPTRMTPKRAVELEDGGSIYWVMKGSVTCRMPVLDITTHGEGKTSHCRIKLSPDVVRTAPQARRPFQGWRYLDPAAAPHDLAGMAQAEGSDALPPALKRELETLGLL